MASVGARQLSSGRAPHTEQVPASFWNMGLELAQVPANVPFFLNKILMAMPATPRPIIPMASKKTFHSMVQI